MARSVSSRVAYVGLGSNLGRRERNITAGLQALEMTRGIRVVKVSSLYETEPVGGPPGQPAYINAVAQIRTSLTARRLLAVMQSVEKSLGRDRREESRWGPRTLDLDLLLYGGEIISEPDLIVPHPLMHERRFVMEPLAEIAPGTIHPTLQATAAEVLRMLLAHADDASET